MVLELEWLMRLLRLIEKHLQVVIQQAFYILQPKLEGLEAEVWHAFCQVDTISNLQVVVHQVVVLEPSGSISRVLMDHSPEVAVEAAQLLLVLLLVGEI